MTQSTQQIDPFIEESVTSDIAHTSILGIDLVAVFASLYRNRFWMLLILALTLISGIALTLLSTPIYRAVASVQINQESEKVLGTESKQDFVSLQDADRFLQTQLDILRSRTIAIAVATDMKLFNNDDFLAAMGESPVTNGGPNQTINEARREQVIQLLRDNLSLELPLDSRVVQIGFESSDPRLAARITNSVANSFVQANLQRGFNSSSYARDFLREQLEAAQIRLEKSDRAAVDYARRTNIVDTSGGGNDQTRPKSSLTIDSLIELNQKLAVAVAARIEAESRWARARAVPALDLPQVQDNQAIQRLVQQQAELEALYQEEGERRKAEYPSMRRAEARINQLRKEINSIASSIRQGIRSEYEIALGVERSLRQQVNNFRQQSQEEQTDSIQLSILQREADTNRQQYEFLLKRYNELTAEAGVQSNNLSVLDRAIPPSEPISPNVALNLASALALGLFLAISFAIIRDSIFRMIRTPDDIVRTLGLPVLGTLPDGGSALEVREVLNDRKSEFTEAINSTRTALLLATRTGLPKSIAFTSTQPGEGKSTTCFALAYSLARAGKNVLIIDADLRRPNQHNIAGIGNSKGFSELLASGINLSEAIRKDSASGIDFITAGEIPPNPSELFDSEGIRQVVEECQKAYDCVILDCPPVRGCHC